MGVSNIKDDYLSKLSQASKAGMENLEAGWMANWCPICKQQKRRSVKEYRFYVPEETVCKESTRKRDLERNLT